MELSLIFDDKFKVAGVVKNDVCIVLDFLENLDGYYDSSVTGISLLLEQISATGLQNISTKFIRCVDNKTKIYEFRKGDIRVFFFHGKSDLLVVCTTALIKKTRKVDKAEVKKAILFKDSYEKAVNDGSIVIVEGEINED